MSGSERRTKPVAGAGADHGLGQGALVEYLRTHAAELRLAWRDTARLDDIAVMHITAHGESMLRDLADWLERKSDPGLRALLHRQPWSDNEGGADSPATLLVSLAQTLNAAAPLVEGHGEPSIAKAVRRKLAATLMRLAAALDSISRENLRRLEERASTDSLTGAMSRAAVLERLNSECGLARRHGRSLGIIYIDLDGLKRINDESGHSAGDALLRQLAEIIGENTRVSDSLGRLGGDEFLLILPETGADGVQAVQAKLNSQLRKAGISISTGGAASPSAEPDPDALIAVAERSMRESRLSGRAGGENKSG